MSWISTKDRLPPDSVPVIACFVKPNGTIRRIRAVYARGLELHAAMEYDGPDVEYDEESDDYYVPEGWYEFNECETTHWKVEGDVGYWQPLPDPPDEYLANEVEKALRGDN